MLESEGHVTVRTFLTLGTCVTTCDHSVICAWTAIKGLVCISGHTTTRSVLMVKAPVTTKGNSGASFQLGHADLCGLCWHPKPYWYWGRAVARGRVWVCGPTTVRVCVELCASCYYQGMWTTQSLKCHMGPGWSSRTILLLCPSRSERLTLSSTLGTWWQP